MQRLSVLLVEDDPEDVRTLREALSGGAGGTQFRIDHVKTLSEAFSRLKKASFDAVLLDLGLPDSQSLNTLNRIMGATPGSPILVLTDTSDAELGAQVLKQGAQDCLAKRFATTGEVYRDLIVRSVRHAVERKRAEKALIDSEKPYRQLFDLESHAIFLVDSDTERILAANPAASRLYGHSQEEFLRLNAGDLSAGQGACWEAGAKPSHELRCMHQKKNGAVFPVEVTRSDFDYLDRRMHIATIRDLTDRRKAEQEYLKFELGIARSSDAIFVTTLEGVITYVNPAFETVYGFTKSEAIGKTPRILKSGSVDAALYERFWKTLLAKQVVRGEIVNRAKDGRLLEIDASANPIVDDRGEIVGFLAIQRDITESKRLRDQLLLAERMTSMGTLAAGVAHEINNPLAALMANLDVALAELTANGFDPVLRSAANTLEALRDARECAERVRQIVRDVKMFSRPDEQRREALDLERVVDSSVRLVWNEIRHRARIVKLYGEAPQVLANEARLGQVFVNLLVNAAQAMPEGQAERNTITVCIKTHPSGAALTEVHDTGSGMPPETLKRVFEPFFTTKPIGVGTGMGLTICRRIVTEFGGEISVESEVGKGTCFRLILPAAAHEVRAASPPAAEELVCRRGRILVVDDDPAVLRAIERMLSSRHEVVTLTRAREGVDRIAAGEKFDLVLSDMMMPEMSGIDFYEELNKVAPNHAQQMVFLTGGAFTPRASEFLGQVNNHRLEKPFDARGLVALIARILT